MKKMRSSKLFRVISSLFVLCSIISFCTGCGERDLDYGLRNIYETAAQPCVLKYLDSPSSAVFAEFERSMVVFQGYAFEDRGEGIPLEYCVYDVVSYVESQNEYGTMVRHNFYVQVYVYDDNPPRSEFGEEGIHKGIENHCYSNLLEMD